MALAPAPVQPVHSPVRSPTSSCGGEAALLRSTLSAGLAALVDFAVQDVRSRIRQQHSESIPLDPDAEPPSNEVVLTACPSAAMLKLEWCGAGVDRGGLRRMSDAWHDAKGSATPGCPSGDSCSVRCAPVSPVSASSVSPAVFGEALGTVSERSELVCAVPMLCVANHVVLAPGTDPAPEEIPTGVSGVWNGAGAPTAVSLRISHPLRRFVTRRALHAAAARQLPGVSVSVRLRPPPPVKSAGLVFSRAAAGKPGTPNPFHRRPLAPRASNHGAQRCLAYELQKEQPQGTAGSLCLVPREPAMPPPSAGGLHQHDQLLVHRSAPPAARSGPAGNTAVPVTSDWPGQPVQWRVGARRRTRAAVARRRQVADDMRMAQELQREFDGVADILERQSVVPCVSCKGRVPFDGTAATVYVCDTCGGTACGRCLADWCCNSAEAEGATLSSILCPNSRDGRCAASVRPGELKQVLSAVQLRRLASNDISQATAGDDTYVRCPNAACQVVVQRDETALQAAADSLRAKAAVGGGKVTVDGESWQLRHALHHLRFRLRCRECSTEFCSSCGAAPYHKQKDCEEARCPLQCRFCTVPLGATPDQPSLPWWRRRRKAQKRRLLVCDEAECCAKAAECCTSTLPCGHPCNGVLGERTCLPCLHPDCSAHPRDAPEGDDLCSICWTDSLSSAPCVRLECGHIVHFRCVFEKLDSGWPSSRISFSFMNCGVCAQEIDHPHAKIKKALEGYKKLRKDLQGRWMDRLRIEGLLNAPELADPQSQYFGKPLDFAAKCLAYYQCFKCKRPYFGGVRRCDAQEVNEDHRRDFQKEDLVCGACIAQTSCPRHGAEFVQFKCRYCCSLAVWFCWGTTHFCDKCHHVLPRPLAQCQGPAHCPLGLEHPPNGQEFALGCMMCHAEGVTPQAP
eukprot:TRINITY_DN3156_c0_g2_i1.p1 TRINITY_DN3156_c0_g2~~TRINITY_DN3156_c0_g2_i1.p1  ORF type:complete len:929 (+),score=271.75 TRINITY_DN3156_c0_g2_i1:59-2788(+)